MPATEKVPAPVIARPPALLGEPAADCFADWLNQQPADAELTELASVVQQAETDFAAARSAVPVVVGARREAEDEGAGAAYADATAKLGGLPRLIGKLAARRVEGNLHYLARLSHIAKQAAAQAEAAKQLTRGDLANLRREMVASQKGTPPADIAAPLLSGPAEAAYQRAYREASPYDIAAQRALEIATLARVRSRFYSDLPDDARIDLTLPETYRPIIQQAAARAEETARKEINAHGNK